MDTAAVLKKVRKIEIKTRGLSNQIFSGSYHSAFKGRGMSFAEVREYHYGDDIRSIDWNVTARFDAPFVKVFEEEREITMMLLVDVSRSADFGSNAQMKNEIMTEIAAVLSFSALNNNDKVGLLLFSDRIEKFIPPKKGRSHMLRLIREMIEFEPEGKGTDVGQALSYLANILKKRSIVFILSDFISPDFKDPLSLLKRRHDIVGVQLFDKGEESLPDVGLLRALDAESGREIWLDTSSAKVRRDYAAKHLESKETTRRSFLSSGADLVRIRTDESYVNALLNLFSRRGTRR